MDIPENNVKRYNVSPEKLNNVNVEQARTIANKLIEKLGDTHSEKFYLKVAYNLPESQIWSELEKALTVGRNPAAYFSVACSRIMS